MQAPRTRRRLPAFLAVLATFGLILSTSAVAAGVETWVECDAEVDDFGDHLVEPGELLTCTAHGLDPTLDTDWEVVFFDWIEDDQLGAPESDTMPAGTDTFQFVVPDALLWFEGVVIQEDGGQDVYVEEFYGTTVWFFEGPMTCAPEPVEVGGTVECVAEDMDPGGFAWWAAFVDEDEELGELIDDLEGSGTADADGVGTFTFEVPDDAAITVFYVLVEQASYVAWYEGTVVAVEDDDGPPPGRPEPAPVTVPQPTRIDTGGGGSAATDGWSGVAVAAAIVVALGTLGRRRWSRTRS